MQKIDQEQLRRTYRLRRAIGWWIVFATAVLVGLGAYMVFHVGNTGAHPLFLLEPAVLIGGGIFIYAKHARIFFDPRSCGLPKDYQ